MNTGWNRVLPMKSVEIREMPYEVTGSSEGVPIILVPGGLSGWHSWKPHAEILSRTHRVVRVQLLSMAFAEKGRTPGPFYSLRAESEALEDVADALGMQRVNLVGWSQGGAVALDLALNHSRRINTLTLIEPAAYWVGLAAGQYGEEVERFAALFRGFSNPPTEEDLISFLRMNGLVAPKDDPRVMPRWSTWNSLKISLLGLHTVLEHRDDPARLRNLRNTPVMLVRGKESAGFNHGGVELIAQGIGGNVKMLSLPNGHACHIVAQDQFLGALEDLIRS